MAFWKRWCLSQVLKERGGTEEASQHRQEMEQQVVGGQQSQLGWSQETGVRWQRALYFQKSMDAIGANG